MNTTRKIRLDTSVYAPMSGYVDRKGKDKCDHDFDPEPVIDGYDFSVWGMYQVRLQAWLWGVGLTYLPSAANCRKK